MAGGLRLERALARKVVGFFVYHGPRSTIVFFTDARGKQFAVKVVGGRPVEAWSIRARNPAHRPPVTQRLPEPVRAAEVLERLGYGVA